MFNLAVCAEMVFLDRPFEERVRRIAESGFQVEIWNWTRHDIDALVGTGAEFSSMVGHTAGSLLDEDGANALLRGAEESLAVAERLGCRRLLVFGTELGPDGVPLRPVHHVTGAMWLNAYKTLSRLAELGERAGVTFCLENLNTALDHPGAPFARANDTLALVDAVARPGLRMMLDLYHAQIGEGNLIQLLKRADSLIGEVQVADVPGRCEPGTGEINFAAIAAALEDMGYRGTVGLEAYASGDDNVALERFSAVFGAGTLGTRGLASRAHLDRHAEVGRAVEGFEHGRLGDRVGTAERRLPAPGDGGRDGVELDPVDVVVGVGEAQGAVGVDGDVLDPAVAGQLQVGGAAQPGVGDDQPALGADQLQLVAAGQVEGDVELGQDVAGQAQGGGHAEVDPGVAVGTRGGGDAGVGSPANRRMALTQ